jgi:8-oxo-dGTP diphosphatase
MAPFLQFLHHGTAELSGSAGNKYSHPSFPCPPFDSALTVPPIIWENALKFNVEFPDSSYFLSLPIHDLAQHNRRRRDRKTPLCQGNDTNSIYRNHLNHGDESFGMLFFADIKCFETELYSEIEKIVIMDELPKRWTYPDIQPHLIREVKRRGYLY